MEMEIIVVDDGSTDGSAQKALDIRDSRIRVYSSPHNGVAVARNTALSHAQGELLTQCDADDLFADDRLAQQVQWMNEHPEFGAVCGASASIDIKGRMIAEFRGINKAQEVTEELRLGKIPSLFPAWCIRTEIIRDLGGWREYFKSAEDVDLQLRISEVTRVWFEPKIWYYARIRHDSTTHLQGNTQLNHFAETARLFQKQRLMKGKDDLANGNPPALPSEIGGRICTKRQIAGQLTAQGWRRWQEGLHADAFICLIRALSYTPFSINIWHGIICMTFKSFLSSIK